MVWDHVVQVQILLGRPYASMGESADPADLKSAALGVPVRLRVLAPGSI